MNVIVGLGNPGVRYRGTRHNVGFMAIDMLAKRHGIPVKSRRCQALVGEGKIHGKHVLLAKPLTFMNLSGKAVSLLAQRYNVPPRDMIIIVDDINLPLGRLRIRSKGSAGGHKGLQSIINELGTQDFPRIRIGIGAPTSDDAVEYVLSRFKRSERNAVRSVLERCVQAVETIISSGIEQAMNIFNAPAESQQEKVDTSP